MLQYVEIAHHHEECQQGEDDEELHCLGVCLAIVLVLRLSEYKRFVGIAESLGYHCHYHGYLRCCTIYSELLVCVFTFIYIREKDFVGSLVEDASDTQNQYWPTV